MGFLFNAASVLGGITGVASNMAYGSSLINNTYGTIDRSSNIIGNLLGISGFENFQQNKPTEYINKYIASAYSSNGIIKYIYSTLFHNLMPDISGYTLLFMAPPVLSGYQALGNQNYSTTSTSFITETSKLCPLLALNFSPPTIQLNTGTLAGSSGTQHYATELNITDSMSVSFIDTINLDVYTYHSTWLQYIYQVLEGTLEPSSEFLLSGKIDYCASFYFVKFKPNLNEIQYVGKAINF